MLLPPNIRDVVGLGTIEFCFSLSGTLDVKHALCIDVIILIYKHTLVFNITHLLKQIGQACHIQAINLFGKYTSLDTNHFSG